MTRQNEAHDLPKIAFPFCGGALEGSNWAHLNRRWAQILFCWAQKVSGRKWQRNLGLGKNERVGLILVGLVYILGTFLEFFFFFFFLGGGGSALTKGSLRSPKQMSFREISERPLTPRPSSENILHFFCKLVAPAPDLQ